MICKSRQTVTAKRAGREALNQLGRPELADLGGFELWTPIAFHPAGRLSLALSGRKICTTNGLFSFAHQPTTSTTNEKRIKQDNLLRIEQHNFVLYSHTHMRADEFTCNGITS